MKKRERKNIRHERVAVCLSHGAREKTVRGERWENDIETHTWSAEVNQKEKEKGEDGRNLLPLILFFLLLLSPFLHIFSFLSDDDDDDDDLTAFPLIRNWQWCWCCSSLNHNTLSWNWVKGRERKERRQNCGRKLKMKEFLKLFSFASDKRYFRNLKLKNFECPYFLTWQCCCRKSSKLVLSIKLFFLISVSYKINP